MVPSVGGARSIFTSILLVFFLLTCVDFAWSQQDAKAPPNDVKRAEFYLKKLEALAERMRGQSFKMSYEGNEALKRIKALKEQYPHDPAVEDLFQRARQALMTSKGDFVQITPEMMQYRENEKKMQKIFAEFAEKEWQAYRATVEADPNFIAKPFPPLSHRDEAVADMVGKIVILDEFQFPTNEFTDMGRQFVYVGSGSRGYYWISLNNRNFLGPYEAVKRYRRLVNQDVPEGGTWTVVGKIDGLDLLVPQAGKKKTLRAQWGWRIEPTALYVPDRTFAVYDPDHEKGGFFSGEAKMEEIKSQFYTITSIPDDVSPERLVEIFATAIKEKNYTLYLECIDPDRRKTPKALDRIMYFWELHQKRFAEWYVHIELDEAKIDVLKGFDQSDDLESVFLTDDQKSKIKEISGALLEEALVTSRAYDERGKQYGSPKPHYLRRVDKKRWTINNYPQPF